MRKITFHLSFILLFISLALLNSCAPPSKVADRITVQSGQIPPDMQNEDFTLIGILKGRKSYDKYVEKEFNEYSGKYVLATTDELNTTYKDVNKYRYVMDCNETADEAYMPASPGSNSRGYTTTNGYRYFILDRKENKRYVRKGKSSFFALEMKSYLQAIDNVRKK